MVKSAGAAAIPAGSYPFKIVNMVHAGLSDHYSRVYEFYFTWVPDTLQPNKVQFVLSVKVNTAK